MSSSTAIVGIDLERRDDDQLGDKVRRAGQAKALVSFAQEVEAAAKRDLKREVDAEAARTGTGFSAKVDGVRATLSDPQPKPYVEDQEAFEDWWEASGFAFEVTWQVIVNDHEACARAVMAGEDPTDFLNLKRVMLLPENALDSLTASHFVVVDDGIVDTTTGEHVPGVSCRIAKPTLSVTPDKAAKARDRAVIASWFGMPVEIGGGS